MRYFFIYIFFLLSFSFCQEQIGIGLYENELINYLQNNYKTTYTLSYDNARDVLYSQIDNNENNDVFCIYTNYYVTLPNNVDPSTYLYENDMNCEHLWPQSMFEVLSQNLMVSDMHHLRPCKQNVNVYRNNKPYGESIDFQTNNWLWLNFNYSSPPSSNINEYSENDDNLFEPREDVKGDIARAMFYFYTIYTSEANDDFFEEQKNILYDWHLQDPIHSDEINRTWEIAAYQNNIPNPFILDNTLVYRAYFYIEDSMSGDVNQDGTLNIVDIVILLNFIIGYGDLTAQEMQIADQNLDGIVNVVDIVNFLNIILGE
tara:strand:+ start:225 stop:1172 length:948 start_codon:yes stop_codon:yes gene_type:complete